jgi:hypothetical protein
MSWNPLAWRFDERFLMHRLRSTSIAGVLGGITAMLLFAWHYYRDGFWSWELLSIGIVMAVSKWVLMLWYRLHD